jgi:formate hydrogenlyase transcriptional activator
MAVAHGDNEFTPAYSRVLVAVTEAISARHDPDTLLRDLACTLRKLIKLLTLQFTLYDAEGRTVLLRRIDPPGAAGPRPEREDDPEESPSRIVWREQQPLIVSTDSDGPRFPNYVAWMQELGIKSEYVLPVSSAGRRLGTIGFGPVNGHRRSEAELGCLQLIANEFAVAMENVLSLQEIRSIQRELTRERDRFRLLLEINNALVSNVNFDELWERVAERLRSIVPHEFSGMALYDAQTHGLCGVGSRSAECNLFSAGECIPIQSTPAGLAFESGRPIVLTSADLDNFPVTNIWRSLVAKKPFGSVCILPLVSRTRKLGIVATVSRRQAVFGRENVATLTSVAAQISMAVENTLSHRELESLNNKTRAEKRYLDNEAETACDSEVMGTSQAFVRIQKQIEVAAPTDSTILIQGETGSGKELVAQAIHKLSRRCERTLVRVNCSAIPNGLLESEFFGHEKGAFTGAIARRIGRFELAHQGTLFLDEVGDIPLELQPKLLRMLQEKEFERVGGTGTIRSDVRLVAATNADLSKLVADKKFRADLYYRLNVFPIIVPPLRERPEDIIPLAEQFAQTFARRMKKRLEVISLPSQRALVQYQWPGNIRELQNVIERAVILSQSPVLDVPVCELKSMAEDPTLAGREREYIFRVLQETNWVVSGEHGAAKRLGLNRSTLQSKMRRLGINRQDDR